MFMVPKKDGSVSDADLLRGEAFPQAWKNAMGISETFLDQQSSRETASSIIYGMPGQQAVIDALYDTLLDAASKPSKFLSLVSSTPSPADTQRELSSRYTTSEVSTTSLPVLSGKDRSRLTSMRRSLKVGTSILSENFPPMLPSLSKESLTPTPLPRLASVLLPYWEKTSAKNRPKLLAGWWGLSSSHSTKTPSLKPLTYPIGFRFTPRPGELIFQRDETLTRSLEKKARSTWDTGFSQK